MTTQLTAAQNLGQVLDARLKPLEEFLAAQKSTPGTPSTPLSLLPWQASMHQHLAAYKEGPRPDQVITMHSDGSYKIVPAMSVGMGAGGGALTVIENPLNGFFPNIPIGSIVVGSVVGITLAELVDGLVPPRAAGGKMNMTNIAVKSGAIVALATFGPKLMTKTGTVIAIGLLGAQVLADILPLDEWIGKIVAFFRKLLGFIPGVGTTAPHAQDISHSSMGAPRYDQYASIWQ